MSERQDKGCPPVPEGMRGVGPAHANEPQNGIVLHGGPDKARGKLPVSAGIALCVAGGIVSWFLPMLASPLVGAGALIVASDERKTAKWVAFVAPMVIAAASVVVFGIDGAAESLAACVIPLVLEVLSEKGIMTPGAACIAAAAFGLILLGADEVAAVMSGTSLADEAASLAAGTVELLKGFSGLTEDGVDLVENVVGVLWPSAYVTSAAMDLALAYLGASIAKDRMSEHAELPDLGDFDLPLWVVAIAIAAFAVLAIELTVPAAASKVLLSASGNALVCLRFAFAAQGLGVLVWYVREKKTPTWAATLAILAALYLEAQFLVMSLVGLFDVWSNLRRLARGVTVTVQDDPKQE